MKHFPFIIITTYDYPSNQDILVINDLISLIDDCTLEYHGENITFDYLIITNHQLANNIKDIGIKTEHKIPITNFFKQTSFDNIFYSNKNDIQEIINYIKNPN